MSSNPITLDQAEEEENIKEDEEGHPEYQPSFEVPEGIEGTDIGERAKELATFLQATPDSLKARTTIPAEGDVSDIIANISGLGDVEALLDQISGDLTDLGNQALLLNIARSNRALALMTNSMLQAQIQSLRSLFNIEDSVRPYVGVTVSGENAIENEDEPVPVVPDSDETEIPTRALWVKASDNNDGVIAIGDDEVDPDNGWVLDKGEGLFVEINFREGILWMAGDEPGDAVELLGVV